MLQLPVQCQYVSDGGSDFVFMEKRYPSPILTYCQFQSLKSALWPWLKFRLCPVQSSPVQSSLLSVCLSTESTTRVHVGLGQAVWYALQYRGPFDFIQHLTRGHWHWHWHCLYTKKTLHWFGCLETVGVESSGVHEEEVQPGVGLGNVALFMFLIVC